jgi:hypothetical protein
MRPGVQSPVPPETKTQRRKGFKEKEGLIPGYKTPDI